MPHPPVQQRQTAAYRAAQQLRYQALEKVMMDVSLTEGCRLLYWLLDWHAGANGRCWPKVSKLAVMTGGGVRSVKRYIQELRDKNYVQTERRQRHLVFNLKWFPDVPPVALHDDCEVPNRAPDVPPVALHSALSLYEPSHMNHGVCSTCHGNGFLLVAATERRRAAVDRVRACGCRPGWTVTEAIQAYQASRRKASA